MDRVSFSVLVVMFALVGIGALMPGLRRPRLLVQEMREHPAYALVWAACALIGTTSLVAIILTLLGRTTGS